MAVMQVRILPLMRAAMRVAVSNARVRLFPGRDFPQGLKPREIWDTLAARLKSRPDTFCPITNRVSRMRTNGKEAHDAFEHFEDSAHA